MNNRNRVWALGLAMVLGIGVGGELFAADPPRRKPGLWEIKTQREGKQGPVAQVCIDGNTDNLMRQAGADTSCEMKVLSVTGNSVKTHAVCNLGGTKVTTDAVYSGDFHSFYKGELNTRYDPPMLGRSTSRVTQTARWIGPCKPGQKGGDVVVPGMENSNISGTRGGGRR